MPLETRHNALFDEAGHIYRAIRRPGEGLVTDATELAVSDDARHCAFTGLRLDALEGTPKALLCELDLESRAMRVLIDGLHQSRMAKYRPGGGPIAFLADRARAGAFQLHLLDRDSLAVTPAPEVEGWVEHHSWSPDGQRILLLVAAHGADRAGAQGAVASPDAPGARASWLPEVRDGDAPHQWRRLWIYSLADCALMPIAPECGNAWEACWAGNEAVLAIVSDRPGEGAWFDARLVRIGLDGRVETLHLPERQLGTPTASASGGRVAVIEAPASDRGIVAGSLWVGDRLGLRRADTGSIDVSSLEWLGEDRLLLAGHRGLETVVGMFDLGSGQFTERWSSKTITSGGRYMNVRALGKIGDCALVSEGFFDAPAISAIVGGELDRLLDLDAGYREIVCGLRAETIAWAAPDGLAIDGWLLARPVPAPYPTILDVHGGPIWHWRPRWFGRSATGLQTLMLLARGYAIFLPNPRGSGGYGRAFAERVIGDLGGADAQDLLSGVANLVEQGLADGQRLGVTGGSYGGYMTAWLVTQDSSFAAAVVVAPVTNRVSQLLTTNQPEFVTLFMGGPHDRLATHYLERSPVQHAAKVTVPVLSIAGALDRCTPASEAVQFHNALSLAGKRSALAIYPEEGHGVAKLPAMLDYAARVTGWFLDHMLPQSEAGETCR